MAIDFEKIKQKVAQLSGQGKKSVLWWPETVNKDYIVRCLPWPDGNDGQPYKERAFYYNIGGGKAILAPFQFGKPDPIQSLITKLRSGSVPESLELAKQFYPKKKYFIPVIVRGEEEQGVRLWSLNKETLQSVLNLMLGEYGDVTDVKEGRDLTIKSVPTGRKYQGRDVTALTIQPKLKETPLGTAKQMTDWLKSVPNLDELYTLISADEIEKRVNDHLNGGEMHASDGIEYRPTNGKSGGSDVSTEESTNIDDIFAKVDQIVEEDN